MQAVVGGTVLACGTRRMALVLPVMNAHVLVMSSCVGALSHWHDCLFLAIGVLSSTGKSL